MKLHEYQAKRLFADEGIAIPRGQIATTPAEASAAYETLKRQCVQAGESFVCNVKVQLHAGGRGKAGGVLTANSAQDAAEKAKSLLGRRLVTKQTGAEGLPVSAVLLDERIDVARELYLAVTIDRFRATPMVLASRRGGVDIEEVAAKEPDAIVREPIDIARGPESRQLDGLADALGFVNGHPAGFASRGEAKPSASDASGGGVPPRAAGVSGAAGVPAGLHRTAVHQLIRAAWALFDARDASLVEINPLVVTTDGRLMALDAKVTIDDNALFRHPDLAALRDPSQEHPIEYKAGQIGISYVGLEGNIGCLVNGAGLAMATNDIIKLCGGSPANFLDVGGGANVEQVTKAFSIILEDSKVTAILVNIFGGIMRCDWVAQGLLNATQTLQVKVPIVVRLQGTNVEEGRQLLQDAKSLKLISVDELEAAAKKVVELANHK